VADPLTLTVLGAVALTEGIKFLYGQATELLKRRRERKDAAKTIEVEAAATAELEGELKQPLVADVETLDKLEPDLRELRRTLSDYAEELEPVQPGDQKLLETTDAVRQILEAVYNQRITFRGEDRAASGPLVEAKIDVTKVAGYAAGVRAKTVSGGTINVVASAGEVTETGTFVGVDIDRLGEK
jgi:hypothetical protein